MDDPNIDWGDPLVIDVWAASYPINGGLLSGDGLSQLMVDDGGGGTVGAGGGTMTDDEKVECAKAILECAASIGAYGYSIATLLAACKVTFGLGCLAALLYHEVLGPLTVLLCADAINKCHLKR